MLTSTIKVSSLLQCVILFKLWRFKCLFITELLTCLPKFLLIVRRLALRVVHVLPTLQSFMLRPRYLQTKTLEIYFSITWWIIQLDLCFSTISSHILRIHRVFLKYFISLAFRETTFTVFLFFSVPLFVLLIK